MNRQRRQKRVDVANQMIRIISEHGRRFFRYGDRVSHFKLSHIGRVWYVDEWKGRHIYTHRGGRWRGFTGGGTLKSLVEALRDYIMGRADLPRNHLGPWREWVCGGDLWGYGADMQLVREQVAALVESPQ